MHADRDGGCSCLQTRPDRDARTKSTAATITSWRHVIRWNATFSCTSSSRPASTTAICTAPAYSRSGRSPKRYRLFYVFLLRCASHLKLSRNYINFRCRVGANALIQLIVVYQANVIVFPSSLLIAVCVTLTPTML